MNLKTYFKIISFGTVVALIYIHMQTKIVELAYTGKDKEKRIYELNDSGGVLTHQILTLKSANHLGARLLEKDSDMQFMGKDEMMTFHAPVSSFRQAPSTSVKPKAEHPMWNLLSFLGAQEAKAWEQ